MSLFASYLRERVRPAIYGPAIALHVVAALWSTATRPTLSTVAPLAGVAALLLLQFRLWDDLEDREGDRAAHPQRVLVRSDPAPFRRTLMALAIGNLALFAIAGAIAVACVALLDLVFWFAYRRLRPRVVDSVWRFFVVLVKYPAIAGLLAATTGTAVADRLLVAMLGVYACTCAYEAVHGRRNRAPFRPSAKAFAERGLVTKEVL
jgi:hypothetical protein